MDKNEQLKEAVELLDKIVFAVLNEDLYINPVLLDEINVFVSEYYAGILEIKEDGKSG